MRHHSLALSLLAVVLCSPAVASASSAPSARTGAPACSLGADELKARRGELLPGLLDRAESVTEIRNGVRLSFASKPGLLADIARVIEQEHSCCAFLRFRLVADGGGPVTLEVRGPRGTRELLRGWRSAG